MITVTSMRTRDILGDVTATAANSSEYRLNSVTARALYESESNGDVFRAMKGVRGTARALAAGDIERLRPRFAVLGVEIVARDEGACPHTYELLLNGSRLMFWWPTSGKTRVGGAAGMTLPTAADLLNHVSALTGNTSAPMHPFALAEWLASKIEGAKAWRPQGHDYSFARVYSKEGHHVHITRSAIKHSEASSFSLAVKALLARDCITNTNIGWLRHSAPATRETTLRPLP